MYYRSIKISDETYRKLNRLAANLQEKLERPVTLDEAVDSAVTSSLKLKLSATAGGWEMNEDEIRIFKESLRETWASWKPKRESV